MVRDDQFKAVTAEQIRLRGPRIGKMQMNQGIGVAGEIPRERRTDGLRGNGPERSDASNCRAVQHFRLSDGVIVGNDNLYGHVRSLMGNKVCEIRFHAARVRAIELADVQYPGWKCIARADCAESRRSVRHGLRLFLNVAKRHLSSKPAVASSILKSRKEQETILDRVLAAFESEKIRE